jgi:cytochrome c biogenesis protein CcdA
MIADLFASVERLAEAGPGWVSLAAALLGFLAVWLSPCHLMGLALAGGYLHRGAGSPVQAALRLGAYFVAMLVTTAAIAGVTLSVGRLAGDTGAPGAVLAIIALAVAGLALLDLIPLPAVPTSSAANRPPGLATATALGATFAVASGPCGLAFVAPLLALPLRGGAPTMHAVASALVPFVVGHAVGAILVWIGLARAQSWLGATASSVLAWVRRAAGVVLLALSGYVFAGAWAAG